MGRLSGGFVKTVLRICGSFLEGVERLSGCFGEAVWRVWGGCLKDLGRLSGGFWEAVWKVKQCAGRQSEGCVEGVRNLL